MGFLDNLKDAIATGGDRRAFRARRRNRLGNIAVKEALGWALDSRGMLKHKSGRWQTGDYIYTVDSADDEEVPGGYFLSVSWPIGGYDMSGKKREHTTIVFDANGRIANCSRNRKNGWI